MKKILILRNPLFKTAIKFGFTDLLLDLYWGKNNKNEWEKIKETGIISAPKSIWFEPTMRCNLNCIFCHQSERRKLSKKELNINEIEKIFTEAKKMKISNIEMIGGEIFVRKDIFEILDLIEEKNMKVKLGTNGILLDKNRIEKLKRYNCIESISISIDGPVEIHNKLRNYKFAYQKAVEAVKMLSGGNYILVIYTVIFPESENIIEFLIKLAKELKVDRITFMPEMFYSKNDYSNTQKYLNLSPNEKMFVEIKEIENVEEYYNKMVSIIRKIKKIRKEEGVFAPIFPRISYKYPEQFFKNRPIKKLICKHLFSLTIIENGDVLICPFIHRKIGNLLTNSIEEIWNNPTMIELRKKILSCNLLPVCKKCCAVDYV